MANIYTRRGDDGTTSLAGGGRVSKDDPRIELLGELDEANSWVGLARVDVFESDVDSMLEFVQQRLFNCSAWIATAQATEDTPTVTDEDVAALEAAIDSFQERTAGFTGFTLPGCDESSARLHCARTVMRRAERAAVAVSALSPLPPAILAFINRSSDALYVAAGLVGQGRECAWDPKAPRP